MILITGGAGFIGSHLVDALIGVGFDVRVIDNESAFENNEFYWNSKADNHKLDISDYETTRHLYDGVDVVYHFAATSRIQRAIEDPETTLKTNVFGTSIVLKCAEEAGVKRFVFASSSSIYGNNLVPNVEYQYPDCLTVYSSSKLFGESLCNSYHRQYGMETVVLRFFNVYGDRQPLKGRYAPIVGLFMKQKENSLPLTIVGDGTQTRSFTHISDIVSACVRAGVLAEDKDLFGKVYNVGFEKSYSVKHLANLISSNTTNIPQRIGEAKHTLSNSQKFIKGFGWSPKVDIVDWITQHA
jgi:UDP-glucose 4-epimerase